MANNPGAAIKSRYAIIGGIWVLAVVLIFSVLTTHNFPKQSLDDGVILGISVGGSILLATLAAIRVSRTHPELAKGIIWICTAIVLVYGVLGILSIGVFILPAVYFLFYSVANW